MDSGRRIVKAASFRLSPGKNKQLITVATIIGVMFPVLVVGLCAYFLYLTEGAETERRN
jgi:nitrate reductase NapE component